MDMACKRKGDSRMERMRKRGLAFWFLSLTIFLSCSSAGFSEEVSLPLPGKPITLDQCVALGLKFNPALRGNQASVEAQKARVEQSLSAYYPQVNFNAAYNANTFNIVSLGGQGRPYTYNWTFQDIFSMGPNLTQTIYDFGRTASAVKQNREIVKASEQDLITTKQTIILNVKQAYFVVIQAQHLVEVAQDVVKQTKQHLDQAQGFYQAGTQPKIYVTNAEVALANAQLFLIQSRNNYQVAQVTLNTAMGLRQDLRYEIEDNLAYKPREITLAEILDTAYVKRPELIQFKALERGQEATIKLAKAGYYPILSGNASYLLRSTGFDDPFYWDLFLGASLSFPLFSGFSTPAQIAQGQATLRSLQAQQENAKLNIRLEGEQAYLGLKVADEQVKATEKAVSQAQENYDLASGRYQVGVGSPLEITDAEVSLATARANNIQALYNYKTAESRIEKAMGSFR